MGKASVPEPEPEPDANTPFCWVGVDISPLHHKKVAKRLLVLTSIHSSKDSQFRVVELSLVDVFLLDTKAKGFVAPGSDE